MVRHQCLSKIINKIALSAVLSFMLSACNYEYNKIRGTLEKPQLIPGEEISFEEPITFAEIQESIFFPRCQGCHSANGRFSFADYAVVKSRITQIENRVFSIRDMPPGPPLAEEQEAMLLEWIGQGAPL